MRGNKRAAESQIEKSLIRIEELLTILVRTKLASVVDEHLRDKKYRMLYESTGEFTVKELSRKTGFSVGKISGLWEKWAQAGLLIKDGARYRRVF